MSQVGFWKHIWTRTSASRMIYHCGMDASTPKDGGDKWVYTVRRMLSSDSTLTDAMLRLGGIDLEDAPVEHEVSKWIEDAKAVYNNGFDTDEFAAAAAAYGYAPLFIYYWLMWCPVRPSKCWEPPPEIYARGYALRERILEPIMGIGLMIPKVAAPADAHVWKMDYPAPIPLCGNEPIVEGPKLSVVEGRCSERLRRTVDVAI